MNKVFICKSKARKWLIVFTKSGLFGDLELVTIVRHSVDHEALVDLKID